MRILVLNAGSSSLKAAIVDGGMAVARSSADRGAAGSRTGDRSGAVERALAELGPAAATAVDAAGHRIVHGGSAFVEPVIVDDATLDRLRDLGSLAPLHNPVAVEILADALHLVPGVRHVAVFDTAFHYGLPEDAVRYPVPERWSEWGVRRYGFHGLSVEWAVDRAAEMLHRSASDIRLVVAHLGSGCSVTAVDGGRSVATSMGMTPLEGLMMGTRAGSIDPGILMTLLRDDRLALDELTDVLEHGSGLLAIAGTADVAALEARADQGDRQARLALAMFATRAAAGIAAAASALPVLDAVVFTGGIGEHAAATRAAIVEHLAVLGIDPVAAEHVTADAVVSRPGARVAILVIEAREDLVIARHVERLVAAS
jgi:acetate kinase